MVTYPYAALAFLSGLQPGAALSSSLWPIDPRRRGAAQWPIDPSAATWPIDPSSAQWPIDPSAGQWPIDPTRRTHTTAAAVGRPPQAVADWLDGQALLSQALRQTRARIVRQSDTREQLRQRQVQPLWRWAADSRAKTVSSELIQRLQVHRQMLWLVAPLADQGANGAAPAAAAATRLYTLPPRLDGKTLQDQVDRVLRAASEREDRLPEVLAQAPDFQAFFDAITGLPVDRAPRLAELLAVMQDAGVHIVMQLKHAQAARRPIECSSRVMPVITTPGHGALPSGHATMAALTSELLYLLLYCKRTQPPERAEQTQRSEHLDRLARRIAFNRVVAGVHFPADSKAGYALGTLLARVFAAMAGALPHGPRRPGRDDIGGADLDLPEIPSGGGKGRTPLALDDSYTVHPAPLLQLMWTEVESELDRLRI